ncbi:MAG: DUF4783 domain-containing protein [Tenuifilaceae bacterium]|jgi:hypothetical protein|nr:DUF4783 domain-containing protein [Tenuifilaceae bacterium]
MRKRIVAIAVMVLTVIITNGFSQQVSSDSFIETITNIFKTGNSSELGKHLNPTVELELLEEENIFSKAQAELLMKDFFTKNKPSSFKVNHQGNKGNTSFAIGTLVTQSGSFRVSVFMKIDKDKLLIHQIRVERS